MEKYPTNYNQPLENGEDLKNENENSDEFNLIVNYIPASFSQENFSNLFSPFHPTSCKLMIDKHTHQSLGYGFVKFDTEKKAEKCIQSLNGSVIEHKVLKVSYARPSSKTIQNSNLYIAHLDPQLSRQQFEDIFAPYGNILECKLLVDKQTGQSKGAGFVRFHTHQEAEAAVRALNGSLVPVNSQPLLVKFADSGQEKAKKRAHDRGPLPLVPLQFQGHYQQSQYQQGQYSLSFPLGSSSYSPYGVVYPYSSSPSAMSNLSSYCLFVYNLPPDADEKILYQLFGPFGAIVSVKIARDQLGTSRGYGFVNFGKFDEAQQAILALNGYQWGSRTLQVSFKSQKR